MTYSKNNEINLAKVLRRTGFHLPVNEDEIEYFNKNIDYKKDKPIHWDDPIEILRKGKISNIKLSLETNNEETINILAIAAREGKSISDNVRRKMNEDRKKK